MNHSMNYKKYQLLFGGLLGDEKRFRNMMARRGVKHSLVDQMLREAPVIVKQNLSLETARKYADALSAMGAKVTILDQDPQENQKESSNKVTPMSSFLPCPRCGLVQPETDVCPRCGYHLVALGSDGEAHVTGDRT